MGYPIEDSDDLGTEEATPAPAYCERCAKPGDSTGDYHMPQLFQHPEDKSLWFHKLCLELDIAEWKARESEAVEQGRREQDAN